MRESAGGHLVSSLERWRFAGTTYDMAISRQLTDGALRYLRLSDDRRGIGGTGTPLTHLPKTRDHYAPFWGHVSVCAKTGFWLQRSARRRSNQGQDYRSWAHLCTARQLSADRRVDIRFGEFQWRDPSGQVRYRSLSSPLVSVSFPPPKLRAKFASISSAVRPASASGTRRSPAKARKARSRKTTSSRGTSIARANT